MPAPPPPPVTAKVTAPICNVPTVTLVGPVTSIVAFDVSAKALETVIVAVVPLNFRLPPESVTWPVPSAAAFVVVSKPELIVVPPP